MKNTYKIGMRFKLDFFKDLWTFDFFFFSHGKELGHNYISYFWVFLFIGIIIKIENN